MAETDDIKAAVKKQLETAVDWDALRLWAKDGQALKLKGYDNRNDGNEHDMLNAAETAQRYALYAASQGSHEWLRYNQNNSKPLPNDKFDQLAVLNSKNTETLDAVTLAMSINMGAPTGLEKIFDAVKNGKQIEQMKKGKLFGKREETNNLNILNTSGRALNMEELANAGMFNLEYNEVRALVKELAQAKGIDIDVTGYDTHYPAILPHAEQKAQLEKEAADLAAKAEAEAKEPIPPAASTVAAATAVVENGETEMDDEKRKKLDELMKDFLAETPIKKFL